jgi:hypothetical protein
MKQKGRKEVLESLREQVSRLERSASGLRAHRKVLAFGVAPLPTGGSIEEIRAEARRRGLPHTICLTPIQDDEPELPALLSPKRVN